MITVTTYFGENLILTQYSREQTEALQLPRKSKMLNTPAYGWKKYTEGPLLTFINSTKEKVEFIWQYSFGDEYGPHQSSSKYTEVEPGSTKHVFPSDLGNCYLTEIGIDSVKLTTLKLIEEFVELPKPMYVDYPIEITYPAK